MLQPDHDKSITLFRSFIQITDYLSEEKVSFGRAIFLLIILILLLPSTLFAQANFLLSPPIIDAVVPPGGAKYFNLYIYNDSEQESIFKIYSTDILISPSSLKFPEAGTTKYTCAEWIELSETSLSIGPYESKEILCKISVPKQAFGGRYAVVMCEKVDEPQIKIKRMIDIKPHFRLGTIIKLSIKGSKTRKKGKIEDTLIKQLQEGGLEIKTVFLNEGNIHTLGKGHFMIRDMERKIKARGFFPEATTYPESQTEFKYLLRKNFIADTYIIEAKIDYGGKRLASLKKEFTLESDISLEVDSSEILALDLDPSFIDVYLPAGSFKLYTLNILNKEPSKAKINIALTDFQIKEDGEIEYLDAGSTPYSCADWIDVKPDEFEIKPGQSKKIRITVNPPKKVKKIGYVKLDFMVNIFEQAELVKTGSKYVTLIASTINDVVEGGEIQKFDTSFQKEGALELKVSFKNSGDAHLFPDISFKIFNKDQKELSSGNFNEKRLLLPGMTADFKHIHPLSLEEGKYLTLVKVKYGKGEKTSSTQKVIEIR